MRTTKGIDATQQRLIGFERPRYAPQKPDAIQTLAGNDVTFFLHGRQYCLPF